jgi:hypothetical protein
MLNGDSLPRDTVSEFKIIKNMSLEKILRTTEWYHYKKFEHNAILKNIKKIT